MIFNYGDRDDTQDGEKYINTEFREGPKDEGKKKQEENVAKIRYFKSWRGPPWQQRCKSQKISFQEPERLSHLQVSSLSVVSCSVADFQLDKGV